MDNFSGFFLHLVSVVFVFTKESDVKINGKREKDRKYSIHSSDLKHGLYKISDLSRSGWRLIGIFPDSTRKVDGTRTVRRFGKPEEQRKDKYCYGIPERSFRVEAGKRVLIMVEEGYSMTHNRFFRQWTMKKKLEEVNRLVSGGMNRRDAIKQAIKIVYVDR